MSSCYVAEVAARFPELDIGPCEGQLVRGHLLSKQRIAKEFPKGALRLEGKLLPVTRREYPRDRTSGPKLCTLKQLQEDPRCWRPICGGASAVAGHHGQLDQGKVRLTRRMLPADLEEFAEQTGLLWELDRIYGPVNEMGNRGV